MQPSRTRLWVYLALTGMLAGCTGGPISDLPKSSSADDRGPESNAADAGTASSGGNSGDGNGSPPGTDGDSAGDGTGGTGGQGGADAGAVPPSDAGADAAMGDAGAPMCTSSSDGRPAACYGAYCNTTLTELSAGATMGGACSDAAELALVCDGAISRTVAQCAQDNALAPTLRDAVKQCARDDAALTSASDDCLDCHVDETLCALQHCLTLCLGGLADECETCRQTSCADAFYTCAGLPKPSTTALMAR